MKERINGKIDKEVVDGVATCAKKDLRSVSLMMEILLREALVARGILKDKK